MATGKRELIDTGTDKRYVRRDEKANSTRWWMSGARFHRIANVTPRTRASRGAAIEATVNAEHLLRGGVRRCLRTNAPLGETRGFRLRA